MNRIYQGRVTKVEALRPGASGNSPEDWQPIDWWKEQLWRHHAVFHDAVNYNAVALAAMAEGGRDADGKLTPMAEFAAQVKERWEDFTHKGKRRGGLRRSLSRTLGI